MVKPVAVDYTTNLADVSRSISGNLMAYTPSVDGDGDSVGLRFVNGVRIPAAKMIEGQLVAQTTTVKGAYGTFQIDSFGKFTYTVDPAKASSIDFTDSALERERVSFKVSDGNGNTDTGQFQINLGRVDPQKLVIDFNGVKATESGTVPYGHEGFEFGSRSEELWRLSKSDDGDPFVQSSPWAPVFTRVDGKDVTLQSLVISSETDPTWIGNDAVLTFTGCRDGYAVVTQTVEVWGRSTDDGQTVYFNNFKGVDSVRYTIDYQDPDESGLPTFGFDDFSFLV